MTGPRVLPGYYGGDVGGEIANAFAQRAARNRQSDLDAVNTGVGLTPVTQDEAQNPAPSGFMHTVRGAIASVQGKQNPDDVAYANNTMAQHPLQVGVTPSSDQPDGFGAAQPKNPGAFNPMTGGFGASIPRYAKLPSGQTIDMAYTPFGERLQQAMMSNQLNQTLLGIRGNQRLQQIDEQGANQANTAGIRVNGTLGAATIRANASTANTNARISDRDNNPSASTVYTVAHRPAPGASGTANPTTSLAHQGVMVANQIRNTNQNINADQKVLSNGLYSGSTPADSANYNNAAAEIPRLKTTRDSLNTVYGGLASKMQATSTAPVQAKPTITKAEFQALRAKGHADADILGHYTVANQ